ncbi:DUF922 domain-containing protein [Pontibacter sp. E15-1]|uniref:DUF922 domain-containing protein n=1 Tax=Pontibacter sp. E15-1 TaxID=2919918 RepID=UPI001F4F1FDA|nr:DUF922 domain-containing protein [Pontibacter sp. E15-1]MCJ8165092.1 DUF922 domain-containing protein [Pontibacter sp. E15-1]
MYTLLLFLSLWTDILFTLLFPAKLPARDARLTAPAAAASMEQVVWSADRRLTWDDFKAVPEAGNPHHALTAANLAVNTKCTQNSFTYQVNCVFLPTASWTKNTRSGKLLRHEQLHFDLTEVYARQLRKELAQLNCANQKEKLKGTVRDVFARWKTAQQAFDTACAHGLNKAEERVWAANITKRLHALEAYK